MHKTHWGPKVWQLTCLTCVETGHPVSFRETYSQDVEFTSSLWLSRPKLSELQLEISYYPNSLRCRVVLNIMHWIYSALHFVIRVQCSKPQPCDHGGRELSLILLVYKLHNTIVLKGHYLNSKFLYLDNLFSLYQHDC